MFGLVEVARALIEMDVDINALDETGATPILWAAWSGHESVMKLLLGRSDANPDRLDSVNRTPLSRAAEKGHEAVVKPSNGPTRVQKGPARPGPSPTKVEPSPTQPKKRKPGLAQWAQWAGPYKKRN